MPNDLFLYDDENQRRKDAIETIAFETETFDEELEAVRRYEEQFESPEQKSDRLARLRWQKIKHRNILNWIKLDLRLGTVRGNREKFLRYMIGDKLK